MGKSTVVPFGPQHPVLPEPIHFDLELEDEKVVKAIPSIGYVHRGLEKLVEKRGFQEYVYVAERVCGICSFGHGWGYSKAIEGLMEIEIPKRAEYLRTIWHEISQTGGVPAYHLARNFPSPQPSAVGRTGRRRPGV